jgi:hypothetical protein
VNTRNCFRLVFAAAVLGALAACRTVDEGPSTMPQPGQGGVIMGKEPEPAPIPQKDVPEGQSSLRKTGPDKRIDQPKS